MTRNTNYIWFFRPAKFVKMSSYFYDFSIDKTANTVTVKREFAARLPLVWDAYTKSDILDKWWAPKPWRAKTKTMDFREGGQWLYAMVGPDGDEHWAVARYQTIQPQVSFTLGDAFTDAAGNVKEDMPQAKWIVTFTEKDMATLVTLRIFYDDFAQLQATLDMGFEEGLRMAMENLDELLARGEW